MQSVKNGFAPPFSACFLKSRTARQTSFCKAVARPFQPRRKALPKSTKTGRKSVGFLILTQASKCACSHRFPPQKHPKNGFVMRFAGKNSFLQVRSSHVLILSALLHLRRKILWADGERRRKHEKSPAEAGLFEWRAVHSDVVSHRGFEPRTPCLKGRCSAD